MPESFDSLPERDRTADRVQTIVRESTRLAYLREEPETDCLECGETVETSRAYSAVGPDGRRGYVCAACNFDPIHDQA